MEVCVFKKVRYHFLCQFKLFLLSTWEKKWKTLMKAHISYGVEDQDFNVSSDLSVA